VDDGAGQGVCPEAVVELAAFDERPGTSDNWVGAGDLALAPLLAAAARAASRGEPRPTLPAILQVPLRPRANSLHASAAAGKGEAAEVCAWLTVAAVFEPAPRCLAAFWRNAESRIDPSIDPSTCAAMAVPAALDEAAAEAAALLLPEVEWRLRSAFFAASTGGPRGAEPSGEPHASAPALEATLLALFSPPPRDDFTASEVSEELLQWRRRTAAVLGLASSPRAALAVAAWATAAAVAAVLPLLLGAVRSLARSLPTPQADNSDRHIAFADYDAVLAAVLAVLASAPLADFANAPGGDDSALLARLVPATLALTAARRRSALAPFVWAAPSTAFAPARASKHESCATAAAAAATAMATATVAAESSLRAGLVAELRGLRRRLKGLDSSAASKKNARAPPTLELALERPETLAAGRGSPAEDPDLAVAVLPAEASGDCWAEDWAEERAQLESDVAYLQQQCVKLQTDQRAVALVAGLTLHRGSDVQARLRHAGEAATTAARQRDAAEWGLERARRLLGASAVERLRRKAREEAATLLLAPEVDALAAQAWARQAAWALKEAAAKALQATARRWLVKRQLAKEARAAETLGGTLRRLLLRAKRRTAAQQRHAAAAQVQRLCRGRQERRRVATLLRVLPKMQAWFRAKTLREGREAGCSGGSAGQSLLAAKRKERADQAAAAIDRAERQVGQTKRPRP
jgi:hypothetical protein